MWAEGRRLLPPRPISMNFARWFSYTRLLESQLDRERGEWQLERAKLESKSAEAITAWADERAALINVVFLKQGVNQPFQTERTTHDHQNGKKSSRAIGPFQFEARRLRDEERIEQAKDEVATVPELPAEIELSDEHKARVREAAAQRGLLKTEPAAVESPANGEASAEATA